MAAAITFIISYAAWIFIYLKSGAEIIYPLYIAPVVVILLMAAAVYFASITGKSGKKEPFAALSPALYSFLLLFLTPVLLKVNIPEPHNFLLRKMELILGASYAIFTIALALLFLKNTWGKLSGTKQLFIFITGFFFALYFAASMWYNYANQPAGDEPIYLIAAASIASDRDIDLKNNYEKRDYLKFYYRPLESHSIEHNGKSYSYHPPLISFIAAPFYAILGRLGVTMMINIISALLAGFIFLICAGFTDEKKAAMTAVITGFSLPLFMFSNQICAETLSALLVTAAFYFLWFNKKKVYAASLAAALALWAHPRNIPLCASLFIIAVIVYRKEIVKMTVYALTQLVSGVLLILFNLAHYGVLMPRQTAVDMPAERAFGFNANAIMGLFFDQEFGMFIYTPLFMLAFAGAFILFKKERKLFYSILFIFLPYFALISSWFEWRGGGGSSPRFFVPVIFIFSVLLAAAIKDINSRVKKMTAALLLVWGAVMTLALYIVPWFRWNKGFGDNWVLKTISGFIHLDLTKLFPSFWAPGLHNMLLTITAIIFTAAVTIIFSLKNKN